MYHAVAYAGNGEGAHRGGVIIPYGQHEYAPRGNENKQQHGNDTYKDAKGDFKGAMRLGAAGLLRYFGHNGSLFLIYIYDYKRVLLHIVF